MYPSKASTPSPSATNTHPAASTTTTTTTASNSDYHHNVQQLEESLQIEQYHQEIRNHYAQQANSAATSLVHSRNLYAASGSEGDASSLGTTATTVSTSSSELG